MKNIDHSSKNKIKIGILTVSVLGILLVGKWIMFPSVQDSRNSFSSVQETSNVAVVKGDVQEITIDLKARSYAPIVVQKGIPVKFNIKATQENINGCNGTVIIPAYNVEKTLVPGDNNIEFTPENEGTIGYSCWMGMIGSSIQVVSDLDTATIPAISNQGNTGFGASCCSQPQ